MQGTNKVRKVSVLLRVASIIMMLILMTICCYLISNPIIETVEVIKEIEVVKEIEVPVETIVEIEPEHAIEMSSMDRELIARMAWREGGTCSVECQAAIVSVAINRINNGYWGSSLKEVINAPGQFHVAPLMDYTTPQETSYQAVDLVLKDGVTLPEYVMYFNMGDPGMSTGYHDYTVIDGVHFGYYEKDLKG